MTNPSNLEALARDHLINHLCRFTSDSLTLAALHDCLSANRSGRVNPFKWNDAWAAVRHRRSDFQFIQTDWLSQMATAEALGAVVT